MRCYECQCLQCQSITSVSFASEPYPNIKDVFIHVCKVCKSETNHVRTLTRKTCAEIKRVTEENTLRENIAEYCKQYGFSTRFLYQSVIVTTPLAEWCFDYHQAKVTLYHESTIKINFQTGDYAKAHPQFRQKRMSWKEVIDYIASHEQWKTNQSHSCSN